MVVRRWTTTYLFAVNLSARKTLKVHTTELTDDVIQLLGFLKSAFTDDAWKHGLNFVCDEFFPCFATTVTLHKASLGFSHGQDPCHSNRGGVSCP
jgi:hypothetical protein